MGGESGPRPMSDTETSPELDIFPDVPGWTRRRFLHHLAAATPVGAWATGRDPTASGGAGQGAVGLLVGDVEPRSAVVGVRGPEGARVRVTVTARGGASRETEVRCRAHRGGVGHVPLGDLAPGVHHEVEARWIDGEGREVERVVGGFTTASAARDRVRFAWSGDVAGQGFGIDPARGGFIGFRALVQEAPDFFVFSGDTVYADQPLPASIQLPDGTLWRNRITEAKRRAAETLDEFRGQYAYNWLDAHYRQFFAMTPVVAQWDDHEVLNNWVPGQRLDDDPRYRVGDCTVLAARGRRAFDEAFPRQARARSRIYRRVGRGPLLDVFVVDARSYRSSNRALGAGPHAFWGSAQARWLARGLVSSRALWKVVACDMPLGLVVGDGPGRFDAVADGEPGAAGFRESEVREVLEAVARSGRRNLVFVTADVHYAAAHRYRKPLPFWEFVAGPLHAGQFGPAELDPTFGPELVYANRRPGDPQNLAPTVETISYGVVEIEPSRGILTVDLRDGRGRTLHRQRIVPDPHG